MFAHGQDATGAGGADPNGGGRRGTEKRRAQRLPYAARVGGSAQRAGEQRSLAGERLTRGGADPHVHQLAGSAQTAEVDDLVVARASAPAAGVGARRALNEHLKSAADEALRAFLRPALDHLHQTLEPCHLDLVRELIRQLRGLGSAPGRVDERERAVVADRLGNLDRKTAVRAKNL